MPNILIIDDNDILREVMQLALEDEHTVWTAQSGEEALGLLELIEPDVVITDNDMPGMSGLELVERINIVRADLCVCPEDSPRHRPKIILYTAMLTPGLIAYAKSLGVAACLPKPFELGELRKKINEILSAEYGD